MKTRKYTVHLTVVCEEGASNSPWQLSRPICHFETPERADDFLGDGIDIDVADCVERIGDLLRHRASAKRQGAA